MGGSATDPFCSCGEENLLGYPGDPYSTENILIHELAHNIHLRGMANVDPGFDARVKAAYDAAMNAGLWKGKYASVNHHEYFAEGVQSWFDDNRENDHDHNHVNTRAELLEYDAGLAALCREVFGNTVLKYTKPVTRLRDHLEGYDPTKAPKFEWPERLQQAKAAIRRQAEERSRTGATAPPRLQAATNNPSLLTLGRTSAAGEIREERPSTGSSRRASDYFTPPFVAGLEREGTEKFAGAVLVSELGCTACHPSGQSAFAAKPGPDLSAVGARVNKALLRRFLASPSGVQPGTTMPDVLGHLPEAQREDAANALAHYLATLGKMAASELPKADAVERGAKLFHAVGCVACHAPEKPLPGSVPIGPLAEKYTVASLAAFLERPLDARPGGRMPDCHLELAEAADIASYLLREQKAPLESSRPDAALAARGKALFTEHRCHACHSLGEKVAPPVFTALSKLRAGEGCLSEKRGAWPYYPLAENQRASLLAAISGEAKAWTPAEQAQLTLTRLNCLACHQRDGLGGVATNRSEYFTGKDENLGEQGRLPPALTGVGAKLKAPWLHDVIANGAAVRPYLNTRMPKFGEANAGPLAGLLKELDTLPPAAFIRVARSGKPHEVGRELAGSKGFSCIACHTFREKSAGAIRALDLMTMTERLEENWFHHYLEQPQRFSPLTIMPGFWPDGKSPLPDVLGGDPGQQRDALWQYLAQGPEAGEPAGLALEPLVVLVKDEAVIIRRAFPGIGKRGIGVGYPGGINLSFDAAQMRLASVWSGGFIEASGLWRGQGAGQARILGKDTVTFPPGPAFAILATPEAAWPVADPTPRPSPYSFKGYTLDDKQRPTLRYALEGFTVEDFCIERRDPAGKLYLERTLKFPAPPPARLHFRIAADKSIEPRSANEFAVGNNLVVRLPASRVVRSAGDTTELLLPVTGGELKLEYHLTAKP